MKNKFPEFYDKPDLKELWNNSISNHNLLSNKFY
jgi:hypothetical protein